MSRYLNIQKELQKVQLFSNLELLAKQVVEGFISGLHKSPFHGFSSEFAEHKIYNQGESTRHIDWKLFAKTDKLYTRKYEEETNLRCHLIIDNSSSMHFPEVKDQTVENLNKIGFSVLAAAGLIQLFKRQRDAVGLSVFSDTYELYTPEKGSERHFHQLYAHLESLAHPKPVGSGTRTYTFLHQIAEKIHRRSMIFLFTDMFQVETERKELFNALRHLKYNKHEVILFHVMDKAKEVDFDFDNTPRKFKDLETGEELELFAGNVREAYQKQVHNFFSEIKLKCAQYRIKYVEADTANDLQKILMTYLIERQKFA
ncbi:DUF58 domain-containing protein [Robertkochia marina]|uniref:DUF58 domain-containing protein n=1 Tax=Robertkochia marina TaxID=1227945 RepID=A0A4S3M622_9FLAO|nr:DUF58 domain-containing protein [Robertkochia marina]THD69667.1 DUF58 domain-containing protein [Robertkochia marina]TRZ46988.1 DUF58 domain-containing protein [Robertkochia marina]